MKNNLMSRAAVINDQRASSSWLSQVTMAACMALLGNLDRNLLRELILETEFSERGPSLK